MHKAQCHATASILTDGRTAGATAGTKEADGFATRSTILTEPTMSLFWHHGGNGRWVFSYSGQAHIRLSCDGPAGESDSVSPETNTLPYGFEAVQRLGQSAVTVTSAATAAAYHIAKPRRMCEFGDVTRLASAVQ